VVLLGVLAWLYAPVLTHLVGQWSHDPNYSHGFFVPAFSFFVIWSERDRLRKLPLEASWSGLLVLAFALIEPMRALGKKPDPARHPEAAEPVGV